MSKAAELPTCLSIIVCDDVFRDEVTKKLIIVGTFNTIRPLSLPWCHPKMTVLFTLTNGRTCDLKLAIEHDGTGEAIATFSGPLKMEGPLEIAEFNVQLQGVTFSEAGKYWICLYADGENINQRPLFVAEPMAKGAES